MKSNSLTKKRKISEKKLTEQGFRISPGNAWRIQKVKVSGGQEMELFGYVCGF